MENCRFQEIQQGEKTGNITRDQPTPCNEGMSDDQDWSSETFLVKSDSRRKPRSKKRETLFKSWSPGTFYAKTGYKENPSNKLLCVDNLIGICSQIHIFVCPLRNQITVPGKEKEARRISIISSLLLYKNGINGRRGSHASTASHLRSSLFSFKEGKNGNPILTRPPEDTPFMQ